jgi:hypothetical protein
VDTLSGALVPNPRVRALKIAGSRQTLLDALNCGVTLRSMTWRSYFLN